MEEVHHKTLKYSKEYEDWLEELMVQYNSLLKVIFLYPAKVFLLMRIISMLYVSYTETQTDETYWMPIIISIFLGCSIYLQKCFPKYSALFSLICIEIFNFGTIVRYYIGQNKNNSFYPVASGYFTFFFQFFLFKINRWVLLMFQIKTLAIWLLVEANEVSINANLNSTNLITLIGVSFFLIIMSSVKDQVLGIIFRYKYTVIRRQNNLKTIVDAMPDGLVVLNNNLNVKLTNTSFKSILNMQSTQDFIQTFKTLKYIQNKRLYTSGESVSIYKDVEDYIKSRNTCSVSFGITQIENKYYEWKGNLCKWNNKDSLILVVRDCTTLIELEKTQAKQLYQTAVLRAVSHELRTPTSAIISANEQMMYELPKDEKYPEETLAIISVSGQLLLNLINNLLDFVQIDSGTFKIFKSYFCLKDLIEETFNLFYIQSKLKNLTLMSYIDPCIPPNINNDSERLKQVLINLLSNALKYTQRGSIILNVDLEDCKVKISIKDTGIGMSQSNLAKVFQLFGSVEELENQPHGCGLKLHISNLLARQLGNESIQVESEEGQGTCFSFLLDIGRMNLDSSESCDSICENLPIINIRTSIMKRSFNTIPSKALIVDDNEFNRYVLYELLKLERVEADESINGLEAVKMIRKNDTAMNSYKLVIMDCQMPVMDGWEATRKIHRLKEQGKLKELPAIIGYSAYSSREDEIKSKEAGMIEFLQKPASRDKIVSILRKYI